MNLKKVLIIIWKSRLTLFSSLLKISKIFNDLRLAMLKGITLYIIIILDITIIIIIVPLYLYYGNDDKRSCRAVTKNIAVGI